MCVSLLFMRTALPQNYFSSVRDFWGGFFCAPAYPKPPPRYQKKSRQLAPAPGTPILLLLRRVTQKQINPNGESQHCHRIDIVILVVLEFDHIISMSEFSISDVSWIANLIIYDLSLFQYYQLFQSKKITGSGFDTFF